MTGDSEKLVKQLARKNYETFVMGFIRRGHGKDRLQKAAATIREIGNAIKSRKKER